MLFVIYSRGKLFICMIIHNCVWWITDGMVREFFLIVLFRVIQKHLAAPREVTPNTHASPHAHPPPPFPPNLNSLSVFSPNTTTCSPPTWTHPQKASPLLSNSSPNTAIPLSLTSYLIHNPFSPRTASPNTTLHVNSPKVFSQPASHPDNTTVTPRLSPSATMPLTSLIPPLSGTRHDNRTSQDKTWQRYTAPDAAAAPQHVNTALKGQHNTTGRITLQLTALVASFELHCIVFLLPSFNYYDMIIISSVQMYMCGVG